MRFNADRLAALAGVTPGNQSSGMLNEASNRSYHEDSALAGERDLQYGKGQLSEQDGVNLDGGQVSPEEEEEWLSSLSERGGDGETPGDVDIAPPLDAFEITEDGEDEIVEIDEAMLKREILRMRKERGQSVAENKVRQAVRREIRSMFGSEGRVYSDSSWVYGDNKPARSKKGRVAMGALGVGFR